VLTHASISLCMRDDDKLLDQIPAVPSPSATWRSCSIHQKFPALLLVPHIFRASPGPFSSSKETLEELNPRMEGKRETRRRLHIQTSTTISSRHRRSSGRRRVLGSNQDATGKGRSKPPAEAKCWISTRFHDMDAYGTIGRRTR
jgi:hypothetical protein